MIELIKELLKRLNADQVTFAICFLIIVFFGYYTYKPIQLIILNHKIQKLRKENLFEELLNFPKIKKIAADYKSRFYRSKNKTSEPAENFFNIHNLIAVCRINRNAMTSAAGVLVGFGVLGTFLGLSIGVSNVDTNNNSAKELMANVGVLTNGMSTAFLTSIVGMVLSSFYIIIEKKALSDLTKTLTNVSEELNSAYYESENIRSEMYSTCLNEIVQTLSGTNDNGDRISMFNLLNQIYEENKKQAIALQGLTEEFYTNTTSKAIAPLLEAIKEVTTTLNNKMGDLAKAVQNPVDTMVKDMLSTLNASLQEMVEELKKSMVSETANQISALGNYINTAIEAIEKLPETTQSVSEDLKSNIQILVDKINSVLQNTENVATDINRESASNIKEWIANFESVKDDIAKMRGTFIEINNSSQQLILQVKETLDKFNLVQEKANEATCNIKEASHEMMGSVHTLQDAQDSFIKEYKESSQTNQQVFVQIESTLNNGTNTIQKLTENSKNIIDNFETLNQDTANTFNSVKNNLDDSLKTFKDGMANSMDTVLDSYTEKVKDVISGLNSVANVYNENVDDLNDELNKFNESIKKLSNKLK